MKRIIYKKTGEIDKDTKKFPALLFRSRERNRNIIIGNAPVEVTDSEYEKLKAGKHGADIMLFTKNTKMAKPMEIKSGEKGTKRVLPQPTESEKANEAVEEFMNPASEDSKEEDK